MSSWRQKMVISFSLTCSTYLSHKICLVNSYRSEPWLTRRKNMCSLPFCDDSRFNYNFNINVILMNLWAIQKIGLIAVIFSSKMLSHIPWGSKVRMVSLPPSDISSLSLHVGDTVAGPLNWNCRGCVGA